MTSEELELLAEAQHKKFRSSNDLAPPWNGVHEKHRERILAALEWAYKDRWSTSSKFRRLVSSIQMMIIKL
jgi:hypothetical protein